MARNGHPAKTQGLYDRIADIQNLAMKLNGYGASVAKYLASLKLEIHSDSLVLDAGCGTGLVTLAMHEAGYRPREIVALDLSIRSLEVARDEFREDKVNAAAVQSDVLRMPFADETFDIVLSCGVLEYTPLAPGLAEAARVLKRNAILVFLPVRPSIVGSVLELVYNFKTHAREEVREAATEHFDVIANDEFPRNEPIAWSKTIFLLRKR